MMNHEEIKKLLPAHSSGDLPPAERAWVEEHLSSCPACRAELAELKTTLRLIRNVPDVEPPPWLTTRIMSNIVEQTAPRTGWLQRLFFPLQTKLVLEIMALLIVCTTGYYLVREPDSELSKAIPQLQKPKQESVQSPIPPEKQTSAQPQITESQKPEPGLTNADKGQRETAIQRREDSIADRPGRPSSAPATPPSPKSDRAAKTERFPADATAPAPAGGTSERSAEKRIKSSQSNEMQSMQSAAPAAKRAASGAEATETAKVRISLIMGLSTLSAKSVRQAVTRSGGTVLPVSATLADRQMKALIPASKLEDLLGQLEKMARIVERPKLSTSVEMVEIDILW